MSKVFAGVLLIIKWGLLRLDAVGLADPENAQSAIVWGLEGMRRVLGLGC